VLGRDNYATNRASVAMFDHGLPLLLQAREHGTLDRAIEVQGLERIALMRPDANTLPWLMLGAALVIGCAVARMRLPGWPLHPAIFLIWGTWGIRHFAFSFFLGWAVKAAIIHASGLGGFARGKPIMVGLIAGELAAGLGWIVVGVVWYFSTGKIPESVSVMP